MREPLGGAMVGPPMTDKDRVKAAFNALRKEGYFARMRWQCCQSCGFAAVPPNKDRVVFYHAQDADGFNADGSISDHGVYLSWSGSGAAIVTALVVAGLNVEWNGDERTRILVKGRP